MKKFLQNYKSTIILIAAIIVGAIVGVVFQEKAAVLSPLGDIFLNALLVIIVPLIFLNITTAITKMESPKRMGKILGIIVAVFLVMYLGLGILFEYVMGISMGFYNIPIVVAFLVAILVACLQNRELNFDKKLELMGRGIGDKNIVTMLLIFLAAGCFVGVVGRSSAESVAYFMLSIIPARFSVLVLFVVSAFVSVAMGTSVGTITLITPIAVALASSTGFGMPLCIGAVVGGVFGFIDGLF